MNLILVLGAGRTTYYLVNYLAKMAANKEIRLVVADHNRANIDAVIDEMPGLKKMDFDVHNELVRQELISRSSLVISLLPAALHPLIARDCLRFGKHFLSASYVSDKMQSLDQAAQQKGLVFLNELGLDPGIDHMSAVHLLDRVRGEGREIIGFHSFTGGLMAPEPKPNPWEYKFTWNPEYVVTAGRDGAIYKRNKKIKRIPYWRLFKEINELEMPGHGKFDAYFNRNSMRYTDVYGLQNAHSVIRYTLRRKGFCEAWHQLVKLGMTDNQFVFEFEDPITHREFTNLFIRMADGELEERLARAIGYPEDHWVIERLKWLGLFENESIPLLRGTPAKFLEKILEPKWQMSANDKDMIYMAHIAYSVKDGHYRKHKSYLAVSGEDQARTAMAKTVGLPLAIGAELILNGQYKQEGVQIPVNKELYDPLLNALSKEGIRFDETEEDLSSYHS